MITEIPSANDFEAVGVQLLNVAWDTAATLIGDLVEAEYFEIDTDEVKEAYWGASRINLSAALAIAQQGSEFFLKARIARISPYLLLGMPPKDWPKGSASKPTPFSDFRTIDAQDLIKVHDSVYSQSLSDEFILLFEQLRRKRNSIMHSVDRRLSIHASELLVTVLSINDHLGSEKNWAKVRYQYLRESPLSQMHSQDYADHRIVWEFSIVRDLLKPAELKRYFLFDKKQRTYMCPNCAYGLARDSDLEPKTALLKPNTSRSTTIWCFVCGESQNVERTECSEEACKGNVVSEELGRCLTCGARVS